MLVKCSSFTCLQPFFGRKNKKKASGHQNVDEERLRMFAVDDQRRILREILNEDWTYMSDEAMNIDGDEEEIEVEGDVPELENEFYD